MPVPTFGPEEQTYHAKAQAFNNGAILVGFRPQATAIRSSFFLKPET
jgi:hypothetical protein